MAACRATLSKKLSGMPLDTQYLLNSTFASQSDGGMSGNSVNGVARHAAKYAVAFAQYFCKSV